MSVKDGKIQGYRWVVTGSLGEASVSNLCLSGARGQRVKINLGDLSRFIFQGDSDPREAVNRSNWIDGETIVV